MSDSRNGRPVSGRPQQPPAPTARRPQSQQLQPSQQPPKSAWSTPDIVPLTPISTGSSTGNKGGSSPSREPRQVILRRGQSVGGGLGFNIVGGEAPGEPIFVSATVPGGPAERPGGLRCGDQLINVNGTDLNGATHEKAVMALKLSGETARLTVAYRPDDYQRYETKAAQDAQQLDSVPIEERRPTKQQRTAPPTRAEPGSTGTLRTTQKRSLHVRALFDYDPTKDAGLPSKGLAFRKGDILHVMNASDSEWWQARHVGTDSADQANVGVIPSKKRVERRERSKLRRVNFNSRLGNQTGAPPSPTSPASGTTSGELQGGTVDRKKPASLLRRMHSSSGSGSGGGKGPGGEGAPDDSGLGEPVATYEAVEKVRLGIARPVILFGPLKDYLSDALTANSPERFGYCITHTTRQPRGNEQEGRDYYFVASKELMEQDIVAQLFIEAGQYNGNLYATSLSSVRQVAESGRHCILDVSGGAIGRLEAASLHPIAVFVRPSSLDNILELKPGIAEDQAKKMFERAVKLESEFGHMFTARISGHTAEDIFNQVKKVISYYADQPVWLPSRSEII